MKKEKTPTREDILSELISLEALLAGSKYLAKERTLHIIFRLGHFLQDRIFHEIHGDTSYLIDRGETWDVQTRLPRDDEMADIISKHIGSWSLVYFRDVMTSDIIDCMCNRLFDEIETIKRGDRKGQDADYVKGYLECVEECYLRIVKIGNMNVQWHLAEHTGEAATS